MQRTGNLRVAPCSADGLRRKSTRRSCHSSYVCLCLLMSTCLPLVIPFSISFPVPTQSSYSLKSICSVISSLQWQFLPPLIPSLIYSREKRNGRAVNDSGTKKVCCLCARQSVFSSPGFLPLASFIISHSALYYFGIAFPSPILHKK